MKITCIALLTTGVVFASCSEQDSDSIFWSETDTAGDDETGESVSADRGTDSVEQPAECPTNSGWPCACDLATVKFCDDESACVQVGLEGQQGSAGFCSNSCDGREDLESCKDVRGFGLQGACVLMANGKNLDDGTPTQCALVCEYQGGTGSACPSGLECIPIKLRDPSMSLCM